MRNVLIINGLVHEIVEPRFDGETEIPLEERYHKDLVDQMVPDPNNEAVPGGTWDGIAFGPVPVHVPDWDEIRRARNRLLASSDWTALPDSPLSDTHKAAWMDYRAKLRDVPQDFENPGNVIWPHAPD